jgi:hypothetical protein
MKKTKKPTGYGYAAMLRTASPKTRARIAEKKLRILVEALNSLACWDIGPTVTGVLDEPGAAQTARDALAKAGIKPPKVSS